MTTKNFWDRLYSTLGQMPSQQQVKIASFVKTIPFTMEELMWKQASMSEAVNRMEKRVNNAGRTASRGFFGFLRKGLNVARDAKHAIGRGIDAAGNAINAGVNTVGNFANNAYNTATNAVSRGIDAAGNAINAGVNAVGRGVDAAGNAINQGVDVAGNAINTGANAVGNFATNAYNTAANATNNAANYVASLPGRGMDAANRVYNAGVDAVYRATRPAREFVGNTIDAAGNAINRASNMTPDQLIDAAERRVTNTVTPVVNTVMAPARWGSRQVDAVGNFAQNQYNAARDYGNRQLNAFDTWQHNQRNNIADTLQGVVNRGARKLNSGINRIR